MRGLRDDRRGGGVSASVSAMMAVMVPRRPRESRNEQASARRGASGRRFRVSRGTLVVLRSGRRVLRILARQSAAPNRSEYENRISTQHTSNARRNVRPTTDRLARLRHADWNYNSDQER